ncbi:hypothetical protein M422DRAFT_70485 [Sphaerobolus stellatus SS14]|uniref:Uncharacterized protein n=1 Tax=Sphaerobolus stellatus (strain SS14) TaxID=990650 RepID=A0A0C9TS43_SPHS4|nr:hypothetical protein M422DRAFT_70485 [Sphaerobolus stellatus SS14]
MPDVPSGSQLLQIARKTLSRDIYDTRPIPQPYLKVLQQHLEKYPQEDNFLVDLEDGGGILTCLDCWTEVPLPTNRELKDFRNFWEHIATPPHMEFYQKRTGKPLPAGTQDDPMNVDEEWWWDDTQPLPIPPPSPSPAPAPARKTKRKRRVTRTMVLSDGETIEYSTSEEIDEPQPQHFANSNSSHNGRPGTSTSRVPAPSSSSPHHHTPTNHTNMQYNGSNNPADAYRAGPSSAPSSGSSKRKRYVFPDGTVIYLTDDEEDLGQQPIKRPRYAEGTTAQSYAINSEPAASNGYGQVQRPHYNNWQAPAAGSSQSAYPSSNVANAPRAGGGLIKSGGVITTAGIPRPSMQGSRSTPIPQHLPLAPAYIKQEYGVPPANRYLQRPHYAPPPAPKPEPHWEEPAMPGQFNPMANGLALFEQQFGGGGGSNVGWGEGPGMGGQFGPNVGAVPQQRAISMAGYVARSTAGDFNLNYDEETYSALDNTGMISQKDFKDFFASAMDDLQEAPKVTDAARDLGLPHVQALMPGLEVRLMPHQLIGVAWMVKQEKKEIKGGILALRVYEFVTSYRDDMGLG